MRCRSSSPTTDTELDVSNLKNVERPDVQKHFPGSANAPVGWRFRLGAKPGATVRAELRSSSGLKGHCYGRAPEAAVFTYSGWSRRGLR